MASLKSFLPSWLHLSTFFDCYICNKSFSYRNKIVCSVFQWQLVLHRWGGIRQTWPQTPPRWSSPPAHHPTLTLPPSLEHTIHTHPPPTFTGTLAFWPARSPVSPALTPCRSWLQWRLPPSVSSVSRPLLLFLANRVFRLQTNGVLGLSLRDALPDWLGGETGRH